MDKWNEYALGDIISYEQPTHYIVESTDYNNEFKTPVLTAGKSFIIGYTNETIGIYDKLPVIIFDDFTTSTQYVNFPFKVKSSAMKILRANDDLVIPKFIFYRMQIIEFDHSTHKRYWIQQYSKIKICIPAISVQKRIVAYIEEMFSQVDEGLETLRKVKQQLAVYRQTVLKEAFEGRLNALCPSAVYPLSKFIEKPRYGTSKKCTYDKENNSIPVYRIPNIEYMSGRIKHDDIKFATFTEQERKGITLNEDDILIIRSNGSVSLVGRAAIIKEKDTIGTFAGYLMRLRIKNQCELYPKYLLWYLQSRPARVYIENRAKSTSGVHNINSSEISNLVIPFYSIEDQKKIISAIESRLSVCSKIDQTIEVALQQADILKQSILNKAFEGGLA